jgi:choline dehydrogenase-like flavoprotein
MPDYQVKRWNREHGVEMSSEEMERHYEEVENVFRIEPTPPEVQGRRNALFKVGADAMGIESEPIRRAVTGCKGSARCITGCPNSAKNSPDFAIVPEFIENGGRVLTSVHINKLIMRGNRCAGATGWTTDAETGKKLHKVRITAKCTVIAAGCTSTPTIMQRSKLKNKLVGKNFRTHPGIYTLGEYDEAVNPWMGATQGYHSTHFLEDHGIKLETLWVNAPLIAAKFPGIGNRYKEHLGNYRNMSVVDAWVSGDDSIGAVRALPGGGKDIPYTLGQGDARRMKEATALTAELLFHSGAHTVYTGMNGQFATLYDLDDVQSLREQNLGPADFTTGSQHLYGTTAMGADRDRHVCDSNGAVYGVENLYVADTGLMPISPGGNPMLPLMAIANKIGEHVATLY